MPSIHRPEYREFLKRLKAARRAAGMTQTEAAKALGKPQSFVSKCESGERRLDVIELDELARLYRKRLSYFLPGPRRTRPSLRRRKRKPSS